MIAIVVVVMVAGITSVALLAVNARIAILAKVSILH